MFAGAASAESNEFDLPQPPELSDAELVLLFGGADCNCTTLTHHSETVYECRHPAITATPDCETTRCITNVFDTYYCKYSEGTRNCWTKDDSSGAAKMLQTQVSTTGCSPTTGAWTELITYYVGCPGCSKYGPVEVRCVMSTTCTGTNDPNYTNKKRFGNRQVSTDSSCS